MEAQLNSQYSQNGMNIAISIFNFPQDFNLNLRLKALRYLFSFHKKIRKPSRREIIEHSLSFLKSLLSVSQIVSFAVIELADILYVHAPETQAKVNELILNRERRIREEQKIPERKVLPKTVYQDKQNVHNSTINQSVLLAAKKLIEKYKTKNIPLEEKYFLIESIINTKEFNNKSLLYIKENTGTFGEDITLLDTFISVWFFINTFSEPIQKELYQRVKEELEEMNGLCSTGHIARVVNILQGYTDDFIVKISEKDRCKGIVHKYLMDELKKCNDEKIIDTMHTGSKEFTEFINKAIDKKIEFWKKEESQEFLKTIPEIVNNFCGS